MLGFLCKKLFQNTVHAVLDSTQFTHSLQKNQFFILTYSFSSIVAPISTTNQHNKKDFTISYLIHSCGLSEDVAKSTAKNVLLKTKEKPDSVLEFFRNVGLSHTQITNIVAKSPTLLLFNPDKILKPKFDFFSSVGASPEEIIKICLLSPTVLSRSLQNHIIPSFEYLKSLLQTNSSVIHAIKRSPWLIIHDLQITLAPNICFLKNCGVPDSFILYFLKRYGSVLTTNPARFVELAQEIKEMGFDPTKGSFLIAIYVRNLMNKESWDRKWEVFRKWGWSDNEIICAFRKHPNVMLLSKDKIEKTMDFLGKIGLNSSDAIYCPQILCYSLEKRIIPRCSVIQILHSKGLIMKSCKVSTVIISTDSRFVDMFVTKHLDEVPELLNFYRDNTNNLGLDLQFKERLFK